MTDGCFVAVTGVNSRVFAYPRVVSSARIVAEAIFSTDAGPPPAERLDWLSTQFDDLLRRVSPIARLAFRAVLLVLSVLPPLYVGRPAPLRALDVPTRVRALARFERGFAAGALLMVRAMLCIIYYDHPDAAREVGVVRR